MSRAMNLIDLSELWLQPKQINNTWEEIREMIVEKIKTIVENRWLDLIYYLWNKTVPFRNLDSELHSELSKKYPIEYSEALMKSWMGEIKWLSQFWSVLRNIIVFWEKESNEDLYDLLLIIPDLTEIPIYDIGLIKKKLWNELFEDTLNNRTIKEQNYIFESLQKYPL